jgi:hypothetical protein
MEYNPSDDTIINWSLSFFHDHCMSYTNSISQKNYRHSDGTLPTPEELKKWHYLSNRIGNILLNRNLNKGG